MFRATPLLPAMFGVVGLVSGTAVADTCLTINFDDLVVGTSVTTQYAGVTFSAWYGGTPWSAPIIYNPSGTTSSEPQCLSAKGDAQNEFSDEYLRMQFDRDQAEVTFTVGVRIGCAASDTVQIRWYNSGGGFLGSMNVPVNGTLRERCLVFVRVAPGVAFRRVEVEAGAVGGCAARFELIDDVSFNIDTTPPTAEITSPSQLACVCSGTTIFGSAYDPDGPILRWRLERKALGATSWTLIRQATSAVINGALATWTPAPSAGDGYYTLRLTVTNACELETVWTTDVWLDRAFNSLDLRAPASGTVVGGTVCADGTALDHCGGSFTVEHSPAPGGIFTPFDSILPPWVLYDPLGSWDTRLGVVDGNYVIRLTGTDGCGNTASEQVTVTIDNTAPIGVITSPTECSYVSGIVRVLGTAQDANLAGWTLHYAGGDVHEWTLIAEGNAAVINGLLGNWDTRRLRPCAYTLRLLVTDRAVIDCNGAAHNQKEYLVSVNVGTLASQVDVDHDGDVDLDDFKSFAACFNGPNRPPACP